MTEDLITQFLVIGSGCFDAALMKVPNFLTFPSMLIGLGLCIYRGWWAELILRLVIMLILLFIVGPLGITGFGDLKLWMALVALQGAYAGTLIFLSGCIVLIAYVLLENPSEAFRSIFNTRRTARRVLNGKRDEIITHGGYPLAFFILVGYSVLHLYSLLV